MRRVLAAGAASLIMMSGTLTAVAPATAVLVVTGGKKAVNVSSTSDVASQPQVAMSADGTRATAVWVSSTTGTPSGPYELRSASATIGAQGASWGSVTKVSDVSLEMVFSYSLDVEVSSDGAAAVVAWSDKIGGRWRVLAASAAVSGRTATWSGPQAVSDEAYDAQSGSVQVSADGTRALLAWNDIRDTGWSVQVASGAVASGGVTWGAPKRLWTPNPETAYYQYIDGPQARMNTAGTRATIAWVYQAGSGDYRVQSASGTVSGAASASTTSWGSISTMTTAAAPISGLRLAAADDGTRATALWQHANGDESAFWLFSVSADIPANPGTTATWGTPTRVTDEQAVQHVPQLDVSANGARAVVAWMVPTTDSFGGPATSVMVAAGSVASRTLTLGAAEQVSEEAVNVILPSLGVSADGLRVAMTWLRRNGDRANPSDQVQLAAFSIDGTEVSPVDLWPLTKRNTVHATQPSVRVSSDATRASVVWSTDFSDYDVVQSTSTVLEYRGDPKVTSVSPTSGPLDGGNIVTITGENFYDGAEVWFGFNEVDPGDVTVVSPTTIRVKAPEGDEAGKVSVSVITESGETKRNRAYTYVKVADPTITKVTPAVGGLAGGAEVTITGTRFTNIRDVLFGTVDADIVDYVSSTEIVVEIPRGKKLGSVPITIKTTSGSVTSPDAFTYVEVPAQPAGVQAEQSGRRVSVTWDAPGGSLTGFVVSCVRGDLEITRTVGAKQESVDLQVPVGQGTFQCQVAALGRGGAQGQFSRVDRAQIVR